MNVVELAKPPTPDPDAVAFLEDALKRVRSGDAVGVLMLTQGRDGAVSYQIAGITERFLILGYLSHALYKLQSDP